MKASLDKAKEQAIANPKVQKLMENEKFILAVKHAPLAYRILIIFLFVWPLIIMLLESNCYAMDRPDYFWPVKEGTKDTEDYSVTNVSAKFKWIFFLGLLTHVASLALQKIEEKQVDKFQNMEYANSQQYEEVHIKHEKMLMNLKKAKLGLFICRILFFLWIMFARFSHTGKVCSGDFNGYDVLKKGSNFDEAFSYTYLGFPGWVMKLYIWIFMIVLMIRGTLALYLDTDWDPENADNYDDNYGRASGSFSTTYDYEANNRRSRWDNTNPRNMYDSPGGSKKDSFLSPDRNKLSQTSPSKFQKNKSTDFEKRIHDQMQKNMKAKVEGRKYSSKERSSSKKALQKQMNNFKK